jgi:DNA-directed RNA polymerase subunit F
MSEEETYADFATVRDHLLNAEARRKNLTYEQTAALQHAEWAASEGRMGYKTDPKVFQDVLNAVLEIEVFRDHVDLAAKIAELLPEKAEEVRAVTGSRRITVQDADVEQVLTLVAQHVGFE